MKNKNVIIRRRWWFIAVPVVITLFAVLLLLKLKINSDLESYFPDTLPSKVSAKKVEALFGKGEPLMLIFEADDILNPETLNRISHLHHEFGRLQLFDDVISLFSMKNIRGVEGAMVVSPLVNRIPATAKEIETLRESIRGDKLVYKTLISQDFRYALVLLNVTKGVDDKAVVEKVNELLVQYPGSEKTVLNGMPFLRSETNEKITRDLIILLPLGLLVMIVFLLLSFREFRGVWLPLSVVIISTVVSMAILPLMGWDLSLIGVLIPIMMIAIANNYGVHFVAFYQETNAHHPRWGMRRIVTETLSHLKRPIILTGLTTIVGILGLITHLMIPARQMGVISALGVGMALLLSLTFLPALFSLLKKGKIHNEFQSDKNGFFGDILEKASLLVNRRPKRIIGFFIVAFVVVGSCISFLKIASDNDEVLPKRHPYNQSIQIANRHFGGTKFLTILFEGDIQDPKLLKRMDLYETELKKEPEIGSVTSLATVIKIMSRAMNDFTSKEYNAIPETRDAVAQYLLLYSMSGDPEDFESLVNFDYSSALLNIQFQANDMKTLNKVITKIRTLVADDQAKPILSGFSLTDKEMAESIKTGQVYSLIFAIAAILFLLMLIFRSSSAGFIGIIPLLFAVVCTFGLMGILGIELNIATALLSSVSVGLGVDYTIHVFWRLKTELRHGNSYSEAITTTLKTTGRGIVINALSVMLGFSVLYLSAFPYLKMFATLIILSLFLCLVCALLLIPAICSIVKPDFLQIHDTRMEIPERD
jgi:predicted RND superfamily exporter protein